MRETERVREREREREEKTERTYVYVLEWKTSEIEHKTSRKHARDVV